MAESLSFSLYPPSHNVCARLRHHYSSQRKASVSLRFAKSSLMSWFLPLFVPFVFNFHCRKTFLPFSHTLSPLDSIQTHPWSWDLNFSVRSLRRKLCSPNLELKHFPPPMTMNSKIKLSGGFGISFGEVFRWKDEEWVLISNSSLRKNSQHTRDIICII